MNDEFQKLLDTVTEIEMKEGDFLNLCNKLKALREKVVTNQLYDITFIKVRVETDHQGCSIIAPKVKKEIIDPHKFFVMYSNNDNLLVNRIKSDIADSGYAIVEMSGRCPCGAHNLIDIHWETEDGEDMYSYLLKSDRIVIISLEEHNSGPKFTFTLDEMEKMFDLFKQRSEDGPLSAIRDMGAVNMHDQKGELLVQLDLSGNKYVLGGE